MTERRHRIILVIVTLLFLGFVVRIAVLTIGSDNQEKANLGVMTRSPYSLERLNVHATELARMTENIEDYSFGEIRRAIDETTNLVILTDREIEAQYNAWLNVKATIDSDSEYYNRLQAQLSQAQKMQNAEIMRLQTLLREAGEPSLYSSVLELLFTFVVGVFSSLAATLFWLKWRDRVSSDHR